MNTIGIKLKIAKWLKNILGCVTPPNIHVSVNIIDKSSKTTIRCKGAFDMVSITTKNNYHGYDLLIWNETVLRAGIELWVRSAYLFGSFAYSTDIVDANPS